MSRALPEDPLIRSLVQQARRSQVSRRAMLAGSGGVAAALALAACAPAKEAPKPAKDVSATDKTLTWSNWPGYMDEDDDKNYPTLMRFEEESGITVTYNVDVDDNNSYYAKVRDQLALGQDIGADTVCLTDWMVSRLIRLGYTQELDHANIPNLANLSPSLKDPDFDPGRTNSLPWQGGFAGLCWNKEKLPNGLKSVSDLWAPELKGKVGVLSEMRDTMGLIMLQEGIDISGDFSAADFTKAIDVFRERSTAARSATSRATPTWTTSPMATRSPRSSGRAMSRSSMVRPVTSSASRSPRPAERSGTTTSLCRSAPRARPMPRSS